MAKKKSTGPTMPPEALEFFRATGAIGGRAKVPKGLGAMSEEKKKKVLAAALKTRRANAKKNTGTKKPVAKKK